jgi:hypothetical protein
MNDKKGGFIMKRALSVLLSGIMVMGLTACGGNQGSISSSAKASGEVDLSERVVITYMTTGDRPTNNATDQVLEELNKILIEKVNAELDIYYIEWTNYLSMYNLTLAQLDGTVDLVGTATDWLDAWPNVKKGAFLELDEQMLKTYAPKTWESVPDEHWEMCKYEGDIYLMPENNYAQWINHGWMYRMDWAKEAGLTNGVHSWPELTEYIKYVRRAYPDVIPWDADGSNYPALGYIQSHLPYVSIDGLGVEMFGATKEDLYTVFSPFYEGDELLEYAKLMKEWDQLGTWKTDVLNNTADNREELYLGQTALDQHHTETWYGTVRPKMDENFPGSDVGFFYYGEENQNLTKMSITHGAMAISAASKNPERALMVYDLLRNDEECNRLFTTGIEGIQYEYVDKEERLIRRPDSYDSDRDGIVTNYWWGRNDDIGLRDAARAWDPYEELVDIYETFAIDYPYGQVVWVTDPVRSQISNLSDLYNEYMPKICYGKFDNAEAIVSEFRAKLKAAGIEQVIAELQSQMDEFKASIQ